MRLRVEINDELLAKAKAALGLTRTKAVVETALRQLIESGRRDHKARVLADERIDVAANDARDCQPTQRR
jgi:Arc/MetJ family transcription regulator